jgi:deoxyadenosine/deoxycytidine kinase
MNTRARKKIFFVEANIGACKTTLLMLLKKEGYTVLEEPLNIWKERYCEKDGSNILGKFYADTSRWSFDFEVMAFVTRKKQLLDALADPSDVVIVERSLYTDRRTFALNLYQNGSITEMQWKIYDDFFWSMMSEIDRYYDQADCYYLYINTNVQTCWDRKIQRGRKEEKDMVPNYLYQLDETLKAWLTDADTEFPVLVIDGHQNEESVLRQAMRIIGSTNSK